MPKGSFCVFFWVFLRKVNIWKDPVPETKRQRSSVSWGYVWHVFTTLKTTVDSGLKSGYRISTCQHKLQPYHRKVMVVTWTSPRNDSCTLLGSNMSFSQGRHVWRWFFFSPGGICDRSPEGYLFSSSSITQLKILPLSLPNRTACLVPSDRARFKGKHWRTSKNGVRLVVNATKRC